MKLLPRNSDLATIIEALNELIKRANQKETDDFEVLKDAMEECERAMQGKKKDIYVETKDWMKGK